MTSPTVDLPHARTGPALNHRDRASGLSLIKALKIALGAMGLAIVAAVSVWLVTEPVEIPAPHKLRLPRAEARPESQDGVPAPAPAPAPGGRNRPQKKGGAPPPPPPPPPGGPPRARSGSPRPPRLRLPRP